MPNDTTKPHEHHESTVPHWRKLLLESRARFREALGDKEIDVDELFHQMRNERDIEILSTIYGEEKGREMVLGSVAEIAEAE